ncbi:hypothetical protein ACN6K9_007197 [Streptomyces sp. SAS_267]|uniref:bifunctional DNA primase/polymerase n=1 Tax=Streptomyces sp. SAS_267 TaxID=3412750 RepID=UPI00403C274A
MSSTRNPPSSSPHSPGVRSPEELDVSGVTAEGAAWLASAGTYPRSTLALWRERPDAPVVLLCGSAFDVVSASALFGRRMLDRLWDEGPGSGPVAAYRGRILLFAAPGTAQRLPSLMEWEEWGVSTSPEHAGASPARAGTSPERVGTSPSREHVGAFPGPAGAFPERAGAGERGGRPAAGAVQGPGGPVGSAGPGHGPRAGRCREVPPLLCHGTGDAVTVPPLNPGSHGPEAVRADSRWLVAPDTRRPWLPGPEILLWAAVRAARAAAASAVRISIFPRADQDAKVYDVSRRR